MNASGISGAGAHYSHMTAAIPRFTTPGASGIIVGGKVNIRGSELHQEQINQNLSKIGYELKGPIEKTPNGWSAPVAPLASSADQQANKPGLY